MPKGSEEERPSKREWGREAFQKGVGKRGLPKGSEEERLAPNPPFSRFNTPVIFVMTTLIRRLQQPQQKRLLILNSYGRDINFKVINYLFASAGPQEARFPSPLLLAACFAR